MKNTTDLRKEGGNDEVWKAIKGTEKKGGGGERKENFKNRPAPQPLLSWFVDFDIQLKTIIKTINIRHTHTDTPDQSQNTFRNVCGG